jgi:hypothetical protein
MSKWKFLVPPAAVPLALWMFVALAGPGGVVEIDNGAGSTPAVGVGSGAVGVGGDTRGADSAVGAGGDAAGADAYSTENTGNGSGCEEALSVRAQARTELEGHVADGSMPATGVEGNQNALDKQCAGAFAEGSQAGTTPPVEPTATGPGKSEQAPGAPAADGQAQGQGQAAADGNGNGAVDAPGQNKP